MCGILFYAGENESHSSLLKRLQMTEDRGPDNSRHVIKNKFFFGFNRLRVNGINTKSDQPMELKNVILICNGEIYNYKQLIKTYNLDYETSSDCEVIIHLYKLFGIEETLIQLDGVFAFVLYDIEKDKMFAARDQIGIRPLFIGRNKDSVYISSEMKSIDMNYEIKQFPPATYCDVLTNRYCKYIMPNWPVWKQNINDIHTTLRRLLRSAVEKRLLSDRPIACLLSGGLDSTLVTALVKEKLSNQTLDTYAIGLKGSVDLQFAKLAALNLKTNHTSIEVSEREFLDAIRNTIYVIESYDTTTVRASVGNYLISKYIKENSKNTVIFCGDVADEIFGSYRGFLKAPNSESFQIENELLLINIHYFDVLRSDRSISGAGLEARVPFADKELVSYVMRLDPELKMFNKNKMEKKILRDAFKGVIPDDLLYRRKEAFSDGVSSMNRSWFTIIKEEVSSVYTDTMYNERIKKYTHNTPYDKESLFYREIFEEYYPQKGSIIPYFWRHPFGNEKDPSARLLDVY